MVKKGNKLLVESKRYIVSLSQVLRDEEVSKILSLNRSTVGKVHKRVCENKTAENKPRSGRPKVFSARCRSALSTIVKRNRTATVSEISAEFQASTNTKVCEKTIRKKLHELGFSKCVPAKKIIRDVNRQKRLQYCRGKLHWTVNNHWKRVIFSDEMMIILSPNGRFKL